MGKKIKLIFNPIANLGRAWSIASSLLPIVQEFGGADWTGTVYPTHATELAYKAGLDGYDLVIALGGDGTVHEVVNGLMKLPAEQRPVMGVVPLGSGNDFANGLGISSQSETALRQVLSGTPQPVDVGVVEDNLGRREYWINTIGLGFDSIVTIRSRKIPVVHGFAVYFAAVLQTMLLNYVTFHLQLKVDDQSWQETDLMFVACNGKREGGGFRVAPKADLFDGSLDFISVEKIPRLKMLYTLPYFLNGSQNKLPYIHTGKFKRMELTSDIPLIIHADGEVFAGLSSKSTQLLIEIIPGGLKTICG
ncbi:MAG: diacylglycerol kinase family lipid kinase [Anaerolineaceae bacterium]|nr:diacylglycerol kinase family lipid kinase [Anaerolineaceae bacterium]